MQPIGAVVVVDWWTEVGVGSLYDVTRTRRLRAARLPVANLGEELRSELGQGHGTRDSPPKNETLGSSHIKKNNAGVSQRRFESGRQQTVTVTACTLWQGSLNLPVT